MMNKRNTEGYVLAYLLIVITVMGLIAATLMASTVQVMSAQQNSIRYMQDKYAAMGEIEQLIANLETLETPLSRNSIDSLSDAEAGALINFSEYILVFKQNGILVPSTGQPNLSDKSVTFDVTSTYGNVTITTQIITYPIYTLSSYTLSSNTTDEDGNSETTDDQETTYGYTVTGAKSTKINSYTLTGGGT